eukprot:430631-Pyramimonas_sp.AAC.1
MLFYGAGSGTMTVPLESRVRSTQRRMIRMVFGSPRRWLPEVSAEAKDRYHLDNSSDIPEPDNSSTDSSTTNIAATSST